MCHKLAKKCVWRATLLYVYGLIGGCILYIIEREPESSRQLYSRLSKQLQQNFTAQFNISINESDFNLFMKKAFDVVTVGNKPDWNIITGLSFAMTSLTTVGEWKLHKINHLIWGQFIKTFTSVIYKCSHCFRGWK